MTDAFTMLDEDLIEDCCDILGVDEDATLEEIRAAFRQQAKLLHPDRNRSATATDDFIRLGEAYRILREATPRRASDSRVVESAPVVVPPRPRWRAAGAVVVALVVSVGAASTFAYLGLRGGTVSVAASRVAEVAPAPSAPLREPTLGGDVRVATASVEQKASSKPLISATRIPDVPVSGAQVSNPDIADADAFEALAAAHVDIARPTRASTPGPEGDEALVASLVDSMDAPLADPQTKASLQTLPRVPAAAAPHRVAPRMVLAAKPAPPPVGKPIALRQRAATPRFVRAYPWRPYPMRAAIYARYSRVPVRHATARRYQARQWQAAPVDWPF